MNLLSGVRLGVGLKLSPGLSVFTLNQIMIFTPIRAPGADGRQGPRASDEDIYRASYIRRVLAREGPSAAEASGGELSAQDTGITTEVASRRRRTGLLSGVKGRP